MENNHKKKFNLSYLGRKVDYEKEEKTEEIIYEDEDKKDNWI